MRIVGEAKNLHPLTPSTRKARAALLHVSSDSFEAQIAEMPGGIDVVMIVSGGLISDGVRNELQMLRHRLLFLESLNMHFLDPGPWLVAWSYRDFDVEALPELVAWFGKHLAEVDNLLALKNGLAALPVSPENEIEAGAALQCSDLLEKVSDTVFIGIWGAFTLPRTALEFLLEALRRFAGSGQSTAAPNARTVNASTIVSAATRLPDVVRAISNARHKFNTCLTPEHMRLQMAETNPESYEFILSQLPSNYLNAISTLTTLGVELHSLGFEFAGRLRATSSQLFEILQELHETMPAHAADFVAQLDRRVEKMRACTDSLHVLVDIHEYPSGLRLIGHGLLSDDFREMGDKVV